MNKIFARTALLAFALAAGQVYAAGEIDFIEGAVNITDAKGELRVPVRGQRVEAGDTIVTGRDGEIHMRMDDNGLIAVRPGTLLKIEAYAANGRDDDRVLLQLLRGTFRSVTGWIGRGRPEAYAVRTASATIGIRGTDHEPLVIDEGPEAGTYDKVNSGGTSLDTNFGKTNVAPGQAGFAPRNSAAPPKVLAAIPPVFKPTKNEAEIDKSKEKLEKEIDNRARQKQQSNVSQGGGATDKPKLGDLDDIRNAERAFDDLLRAYEQGNTALMRLRLNPAMIGYQKLIDDIIAETNQCKQMRIQLQDKQVQAGPDLAVIQTGWQKRCLDIPDFTPRFETGRSTILMHKERGGWTMAAISGNNLFASNALRPVLARMTATPASIAAGRGNLSLGITLRIVDPDQAGRGFVPVAAAAFSAPSTTDTENLRLPEIARGVFQGTFSFSITRAVTPTSNNGVIEIDFGFGAGSNVSFTYIDPNPGPSGVPTPVRLVVPVN